MTVYHHEPGAEEEGAEIFRRGDETVGGKEKLAALVGRAGVVLDRNETEHDCPVSTSKTAMHRASKQKQRNLLSCRSCEAVTSLQCEI